MYKRFNVWLFAISIVCYFILTNLSYDYALAMDDGRSIPVIKQVIAYFYVVLRFPILMILRDKMVSDVMIQFAMALNGIFYALIVERVFSFLRTRRKRRRLKAFTGQK
jgi:hypothetical protein